MAASTPKPLCCRPLAAEEAEADSCLLVKGAWAAGVAEATGSSSPQVAEAEAEVEVEAEAAAVVQQAVRQVSHATLPRR